MSKKLTLFYRISLILASFALLFISCSYNKVEFNIIFSANLDGNQDLYRVSGPKFESIERLTFTPDESESSLYISTNSKKLLYSRSNKSAPATILDLESKTFTSIEDATFAAAMGWTPDGKEAILRSKSGELFTATLEGKKVEVLPIPHIFDGSFFYNLSFSPNGKLLLYSEGHPYTPPPSSIVSTFLFDIEKKQVISLIDNPLANCSFPAWSPTEWKTLVYCNLDVTDTNPDVHIYLFDVPENSPEHFTKTADISVCRRGITSLSWSPTGEQFIARCLVDDITKWIFFDKDGNYAGEIPPMGTTEKPIYMIYMAWSPDGKQVIYTVGSDEDSMQIYIADADGSNSRLLVGQPANYNWILTYPVDP